MPQWLAWVFGGAFIAVLAIRDLILSDHGNIAHEVYWGRDFINVWAGGHLIRAGKLSLLYNLRGYEAYAQGIFGTIGFHNYSYPPVSYPLAAAFSLLPYPVALVGWIAGTGALFIAACRKWWPSKAGPVWLAVLTPAALVNIWAGHYGFLIGALFLFGWQWLDDHPRRAGVMFGLMLIKPHLAILVPLVLLIRREWQALISGAATVAALSGGTLLLYGWQPWSDFLFHTSAVQASMINAGEMFIRFMSPSIATLAMQLGAGWALALSIQGAVAIVAITFVAVAAFRRMPTDRIAFLTATCTFLVLPYSFNYDMTVVCVGALALLSSRGVKDDDYRLGTYGFLAPQLGMVTGLALVSLMPMMVFGLACGQFRSWGTRQWNRRADGDTPFEPRTAFAPFLQAEQGSRI